MARPMNDYDSERFLDAIGTIVDQVIAPDCERVDQEAAWPEAGLRALQAAGLGGLVVPSSAGGSGLGMLAVAQSCEKLARACPSTAMCFGMHCVGAAAIAVNPTEAQRREFLEPIARGEHLTTIALSEPGTGSHFWLSETVLQRADGDYLVRGRKTFVTNGGHADSYVISTVAGDEDAPPGAFSGVVVPGSADGLVWGEPWNGLGMRGNSSIALDLEDVRVPADYLLGSEGEQVWYIFHVIAPYFLVAMCGTYLGVATAALAEARDHLAQRRHSHSGRTLGQQPVLQHRLGVLWGEVERTRRLIYHAAAAADAGEADALPAILAAKAEVADCAVHVVNEAMTLVGGIGYAEHGRLGRLLRDARAAHVMAPTTDILRTWVGRHLLDEPLLGL